MMAVDTQRRTRIYQDCWRERHPARKGHFQLVALDQILTILAVGNGDGFEVSFVPFGHLCKIEQLLQH